LRFFFQAEQIPQAILFYNKSLCYAPHPDFEEYTWPPGIRHSFFSSFSVYFNTLNALKDTAVQDNLACFEISAQENVSASPTYFAAEIIVIPFTYGLSLYSK
jgi:hypothetical protein